MKTIFITIYDGSIENNLLKTDFLKELLGKDLKVILLVGERKLSYFRNKYENEKIFIESIPKADNFIEKVFYYLGFHSIPTFSIQMKQRSWLAKKKYFIFCLGIFIRFLGRFRIWRESVRFAYRAIPDNYACRLFEKYKPDLVFLPNMVSTEDYRLMKQSRKRRIKTVGMIKSWDNITTKTFMRMKPDKLVAHNSIVEKEARNICDYKKEISVIGIPQYDFYFKNPPLLSREEFFKNNKLDQGKKLILYCAPGDWIAPYDAEVASMLKEAIMEKKIKEPCQILVRLHPKYESAVERLGEAPGFLIDRPGKYLEKGNFATWFFDDADMAHLVNSIYHADIVINTISSISLESAIFNKPTICVGFDGLHRLPFWKSIVRGYRREHFLPIVRSGGVRIAKSCGDMIEQINKYFENPDSDSLGRKKIVDQICEFKDGNSAKRLADFIISEL
jgi:hypothetical protein